MQIAEHQVLWTPALGGRWLLPSQTVLPGPDVPQGLAELLCKDQFPLAELPPEAAGLCLTYCSPARALSPGLVREHLRSGRRHAALEGSFQAVQQVLYQKQQKKPSLHLLII